MTWKRTLRRCRNLLARLLLLLLWCPALLTDWCLHIVAAIWPSATHSLPFVLGLWGLCSCVIFLTAYHFLALIGLAAASDSDEASVRASLFDAFSILINSSNQTNFSTIQHEMMRTLKYSTQSKPAKIIYRTTIEIEINVTSGCVNTVKALICAIIAGTTTLTACCQYLLNFPIIASIIIMCIVLCLTM